MGRRTQSLTYADVTPREHYMNRRQLIAGAVGLAAAGALPVGAAPLEAVPSKWSTTDKPTAL